MDFGICHEGRGYEGRILGRLDKAETMPEPSKQETGFGIEPRFRALSLRLKAQAPAIRRSLRASLTWRRRSEGREPAGPVRGRRA